MGKQVLVIDDSDMDRLFMSSTLEKMGYIVHTAENAATAESILESAPQSIEIIIIDWLMPDQDGIELCKKIRKMDLPLHPFIIMLTANDSEHAELEAISSGADDYIAKPAHVEKIQARMIVASRLIRYQKRILELAKVDPLTQLLNRRTGFNLVKNQLARLSRNKTDEYCLVLCDIDHFKNINDEHGHIFGDHVLQHVSSVLFEELREYENITRFGGEEFMMMLEVGQSHIRNVIQRIMQSLSVESLAMEGKLCSLTLSYGCLVIDKLSADSEIEKLLNCADQLLYDAKMAGRNQATIGELSPDGQLSVSARIKPDSVYTSAEKMRVISNPVN